MTRDEVEAVREFADDPRMARVWSRLFGVLVEIASESGAGDDSA